MTDDTSNRLDRRQMLKGIGVAGVAGLAGCAGGGGGGGAGQNGTQGQQSGQNGTGQQGGQGSQLRLAQVKSPIEFDPIVLNDVPSAQVADQIFEALYTYNEDASSTVPQLAASEADVSRGGTRYVLELVEGATFQNGDPVTAQDVKYSLEAPVAEETENANEINMVDTIETVDDRTVQIDLQNPYAAFNTALASRSIVPRSVREQDPEAFSTENPVGSGPFQFVEWQEGNYTRLERWEEYWGEPMANLQRIEMVPVEEPTTRVTTLQNGENDVIETIPPRLYSTVRNQQDTSIDEVPSIGYYYVAFNCNEGPTSDPRVREAVDYCFDMDQAVSNFIEPAGVRQYSPLPEPVASSWNMPVDRWEGISRGKNVQEAQRLFEEAGVPSDYSWRIIVPPDDKREQLGVTISNGLQEAGFNANVQRLDWGAFLDQYVSGNESDYNIYTLGWSGAPDPDSFTYFMFGTPDNQDVYGVTDGTYYASTSDRALQACQNFVDARASNDRQERKRLYVEGITTVLEDRAHIPSYNLKNSFGVKGYVEDFRAHPVSPKFQLVSEFNNTSLNQ